MRCEDLTRSESRKKSREVCADRGRKKGVCRWAPFCEGLTKAGTGKRSQASTVPAKMPEKFKICYVCTGKKNHITGKASIFIPHKAKRIVGIKVAQNKGSVRENLLGGAPQKQAGDHGWAAEDKQVFNGGEKGTRKKKKVVAREVRSLLLALRGRGGEMSCKELVTLNRKKGDVQAVKVFAGEGKWALAPRTSPERARLLQKTYLVLDSLKTNRQQSCRSRKVAERKGNHRRSRKKRAK